MKKRRSHSVIIGLNVLLAFLYFSTNCSQPPAKQATSENIVAAQPTIISDWSPCFKLPAGWYEKISGRVRGGLISEYSNVNTARITYGDIHGFKHSLHMIYKPKSVAKRSITVYVYTPDTTMKDFSYEILPSDHALFTVVADTDKIEIVRTAMHEFINLYQ